MLMDLDEENENDDDSDRTETYTPPPLDRTNEINSSSSSEKENHQKNSSFVRKEQSIIVLDESFDQVKITEPMDRQSPVDNYWDQWPLFTGEINDVERSKLESIPDIDIPPSPPPRTSLTSSSTQPSSSTGNHILDILTRSSPLPRSNRTNRSSTRKPVTKRKKKKKPMSQYRPPSPFSPKPDYKAMPIEQLRNHGARYGLSNTLAKTRLIKILDEIYNVTHQYETDTDYELDLNDSDFSRDNSEKKDLSHTPPTPAIIPDAKKVKKRPALHQMSSSDDSEVHLPPPTTITTDDVNTHETQSDSSTDEDSNHEGRFLELTVHELSSTTTSSSSPSILGTPPVVVHSNLPLSSDSKKSPIVNSSQSRTTKKSKEPATSDSESTSTKTKKAPKRPKLETPTVPLKDLVRSYIESNPQLHARVLCYEPIDFEEFHKQMKTDLGFKIDSKELMRCLDDQCITFTLRSRKGAFTGVMRAKRRQK